MTNHKRRKRAPEPADDEGLWVRSDVDPITGTYIVTVSLDADTIWTLDREGALRYAVACVAVAQRAEYDAAVFAMMTKALRLEPEMVARTIGYDLRPDRPEPDNEATAPITFEPGMTVAGKAFVAIRLGDKQVGQLDPPALRTHAMTVLEAPFAADLDAGLLRWLLTTGIDDGTARAAVGDLANWRP